MSYGSPNTIDATYQLEATRTVTSGTVAINISFIANGFAFANEADWDGEVQALIDLLATRYDVSAAVKTANVRQDISVTP